MTELTHPGITVGVGNNGGALLSPRLGINTGIYGNTSTRDPPPIPPERLASPSSVLAWFALTDVIIVALSILVAHRSFIYHVSRRLLGCCRNPVWFTWTVPFVCQLIADAAIAGLVGNSPGYEHLNKAHIFTAYLAHP